MLVSLCFQHATSTMAWKTSCWGRRVREETEAAGAPLAESFFYCREKNVSLLSCCIITITTRRQLFVTMLSLKSRVGRRLLTFTERCCYFQFSSKLFRVCPCSLPTSQWFRLFLLFGGITMWSYQWEADGGLEYKTTDWAYISSDYVVVSQL